MLSLKEPLSTVCQALDSLIASKPEKISRLATVWGKMGAAGFSLTDVSGQVLFGWPDKACPTMHPSTGCPIVANGWPVGQIWVWGLPTTSQSWLFDRLQTDALLLGQWVEVEAEIGELTGEFIASQDQLLALYNLSQSLRLKLSLPEVLNGLATSARQMLNAGGAVAWWCGDKQAPLIEVVGQAPSQANLRKLLSLIPYDSGELLSNERRDSETANFFLVKISLQGQPVAGLGLFNKPGGFNSPERKLARALAQQGGGQLENTLFYQESLAQARLKTEMELAARIQLQLLPQKAPDVAGLEIYGRCLPALAVGGDFYDFTLIPNRPFVFALGDITGKGLPAAMLMATTRIVLHNAARFMPSPSPASILQRLTEDLYQDFTKVNMFATVFVGQYDQPSETLRFANAGHSPVIYCPQDGPARLLEPDGPAMCILSTSLSANEEITFRPGDVLVVATDGFTESSNATEEMFGYDRLVELVEQLCRLGYSAKQLGAKLFQVIQEFSAGHSQDDDQTLVVIKGR